MSMISIVCGSLDCSHVQSYFYNDDMFNYNYAQAKAVTSNYKEAEEVGGGQRSHRYNVIQTHRMECNTDIRDRM